MKNKWVLTIVIIAGVLAAIGGHAFSAQDKYRLKVPGGLAFSEFRGYESWQFVAVSETDNRMQFIGGNPLMIAAYQAGFPANGKPVPDGAVLSKIQWSKKTPRDLRTRMDGDTLYSTTTRRPVRSHP
jgi:hypothetical protein